MQAGPHPHAYARSKLLTITRGRGHSLPAGRAGYGTMAAIGTGACQLIVVTALLQPVRPQVSLHVRLSGTDCECCVGAEAGIGRPPPGLF